MAEDPRDIEWPHSDAVAVKSQQHRTEGNWAVDTINPDGWGNIIEFLKQTSADFVTGQESKRPTKTDCDDAEAAARTAGWHASITPCLTTKANGLSAGVVVAARARIGMANADPVTSTQHLHATGRFGMKHVGAVRKGGFHLGSLYLYDTIGPRAKANLDLLETVAITLLGLKGPWCIGMDANITPDELIDTGWLKKVGGVIHYPSDATCNGKTYDLFVTSASMSPLVLTVQVIGDYRCPPHHAVRMILHGSCRKVMVRKLKAPKQYPAVLPHGPLAPMTEEPFYKAVEDPEVGINELGVMMYSSLERELAAICGQDEKVATEHAGRGFGPRFVWKDMCGTPASTRCRSSDVSRAWGLTAKWLTQLGHIMQLQTRHQQRKRPRSEDRALTLRWVLLSLATWRLLPPRPKHRGRARLERAATC